MYFYEIKSLNQKKLKNYEQCFYLNYSLKFTSYFPANKTTSISPLTLSNFCTAKFKKYVKQSYIMLAWFKYLTEQPVLSKNIKLAFLPTKLNKFTLTKAPIAHKTFSKEQFSYKIYFFIISVRNVLTPILNDYNSLLFALLLTKNRFLHFGSNIFFLKSSYLKLSASDDFYFNYYHFTNK